jgi:uncharacterized RDD family membrane protein YckC
LGLEKGFIIFKQPYNPTPKFMNTNYAGFWKRFLALIIDAILIGCIRWIIIVPILVSMGIGVAAEVQSLDSEDPYTALPLIGTIMAMAGISALISTIIWIIYYSLMESSKYQASVGKLALGLIVTDLNGNKLDFSKALVRNICKIISSMILFIGYIMAGLTEKKQGLHDLIAGTLVLNKPSVQ